MKNKLKPGGVPFLILGLLAMPMGTCTACQGGIRDRLKQRREERQAKRAGTLVDESMTYDGRTREYHIEFPPHFEKSKSAPLIVALHGGGGKGSTFDSKMTGGRLGELADAEGFVRVFPEAWDERWNDGRGLEGWESQKLNINDVGFIRTVIDKLISTYNIDPKRVYVTGLSNGGLMSFRLAQEIPDRIAAVAAFVADLPVTRADIKVKQPIPLMMMNGTADPLMPFEGGDSYSNIGLKKIYLGKFLSANDTAKYWVEQNGCSGSGQTTELPDTHPSDGTRVKKIVYSDGKDDAEVVQYVIEGGGHTWPGGGQYMPERSVGKVSQDFDATPVVIEFFKRHKR